MFNKLFADKKRLISSLVIIFTIIPAFVLTKYAYEPGRIIGLIIYLSVGMLGLFEVFKAVGMHKYTAGVMSLILIPFALINWGPFTDFVTGARPNWSDKQHLHLDLLSSLGEWKIYLIIVLATMLPLVADEKYRNQKGIFVRHLIVVIVSLLTAIFVKSIWVMNINRIWNVLFFVAIAIIADTMAYVGGMFFGTKWFGGKKFAPKLSPKKTWAGFAVGVSSAMVFAVLVGYFGGIWRDFGGNREIIVSVLAGVSLALVAPYGDLAFSAIKRYVGIKDFSNIIPGHGGIFDRIDALSVIFSLGSIIYLFA